MSEAISGPSGQFQATPITMGLFQPVEGPKAIPLVLPFGTTGAGTYTVDLQQVVNQGKLSGVLSCFIDNSQNADSLTMAVQGTSQTLEVPGNCQAYLPVIANKIARLAFASDGTINAQVQLLNIYMPPALWAVSGSSSTVEIVGTVSVTGTVAISGSVTTIDQTQTMTAAAATEITTGGTAVTVCAAGAITNGAWIENPIAATDDLFINPIGTAGTVAGGDNFVLAPGAMLTFGRVTGAITANSIDSAHTFAAVIF